MLLGLATPVRATKIKLFCYPMLYIVEWQTNTEQRKEGMLEIGGQGLTR
jgi:hypothetical protein